MTEAIASSESVLDVRAVERWAAEHLPLLRPPLQARTIAGGQSNLTYRIDDAAGGRFVLRRPPLGKTVSRAHNMAREYRIFSALASTAVPVPKVEALCEDPGVIGASFYLMRWVDGTVVDSPEVAAKALPSPAARHHASQSAVDCLAALHRLDIDAIGLGTLGPRENYLTRQLSRMREVWEKTKTRDLPVIESVHERLLARCPPQRYTGLVHSDYRLGNLMLDARGTVAAVLDWELSALGDVLVDVALLVANWDGPRDSSPGVWMQEAPTRAGEFPDRAWLVARYVESSGFNVSDLDFYLAFAYWRLAVIGEGIKRRYATGALGRSGDLAFVEQRILGRAALAEQFLRRYEG